VVFGLTSLLVNGLYTLLWLSMVSMNYSIIASVIIGWFCSDVAWSLFMKCISVTKRSKRRFIQKPFRPEINRKYIEKAEPEFSTFQHYSVVDRNWAHGVFNPAFDTATDGGRFQVFFR